MKNTKSFKKRHSERGNTMLEFALVMSILVPLFAGMFSIGMTLVKGIQVANVSEEAVLLAVSTEINPSGGLDLSLTQNQKIIVRAANGLGMNSDAAYTPSSTGNGAVFISRIVMVGNAECAAGVIPAPSNAPPWTTSNCPNYGQYVFSYRVAFGNTTKWSSKMGAPPSGIVGTNGVISAVNIATNTADVATGFGIMTLTPGNHAWVAETWADVSGISVFSTWSTPVIYSRSVS